MIRRREFFTLLGGRSGGVAARGASPAARDAGDRVSIGVPPSIAAVSCWVTRIMSLILSHPSFCPALCPN